MAAAQAAAPSRPGPTKEQRSTQPAPATAPPSRPLGPCAGSAGAQRAPTSAQRRCKETAAGNFG
eukprot:5074240-Alexandrium_andersonii.AAC.1